MIRLITKLIRRWLRQLRPLRKLEYIELTVESNFQKEFMEAMQLPHMSDKFPHLEGLVPEEILKQ